MEVWAEVLRRVPRSRLLLKYGGLDQPDDQERYRTKLKERGVEPERIQFSGWSETRELLEAYGQMDLALDTLPYSGGLTTCEALWMGVPVITCPGSTFASRHSTSHLMNAGLAEFVAAEREEYVRLAVTWAERVNELAELRAQLRQQMRESKLCDSTTFARDFSSVLERAWQEQSKQGT